ncbi:MAG TPA: ATP-dependent 6-phosphofructokinase, partial [Blastocatellia bacterium]
FDGLLGETNTRRLTVEDVRGLLPRGGTILGSVNKGAFVVDIVEGRRVTNQEAYRKAAENYRLLELDALVVIGGDGTQLIAHEISKLGVRVVGVPKTIDNDLVGTDMTFGFDTALDIATEALDRLHTTAESHDRVILLEVMGRHVGWIALQSGIAGGADAILIPEIPFYIAKIAAKIREREDAGRKFSIIVVAEGAKPAGGSEIYQEAGSAHRPARLGGIAEVVARDLAKLTSKDARVVVLGHLQRGGSPTAFDRVLASCYGSAAVRAIAQEKFGHMVSWSSREIVTVPMEACVEKTKSIPSNHYLVGVARDLSITFAGEED